MSVPNVVTDPEWVFTLDATLLDETPVPVVNYINALRNHMLILEQRLNNVLQGLAGGMQITSLTGVNQ